MDEKQQARRVLNLIDKVGQGRGSLKQWAVLKLLRWQPTAQAIRFAGKCHCGSTLMISYQLPSERLANRQSDSDYETCGYYCSRCGFSNAGSREKAVKS